MDKFVLLFVIALCGKCTSSAIAEESNRIINAFPATEQQFPYMVSLQQINQLQSSTRGHRCGGALVSLQHALTAALCVFNNNNGVYTLINAGDHRVFAGSALLTNDNSADRVRNIANFTVHPQYVPSNLYVNDIAIITLITPFLRNTVTPVRMSVTDPTQQGGLSCVVSGWGAQDTITPASTQLMHLPKTLLDQETCRALFNSPIVPAPMNILDSMTCAITVQAFSAGCSGDYGNPLVCDGNLNGILVRHNGCVAAIGAPEVYTRISSYRAWVNGITGGASTFQPGIAVIAVIAIVQIITTML